jgi:hypothetical protein
MKALRIGLAVCILVGSTLATGVQADPRHYRGGGYGHGHGGWGWGGVGLGLVVGAALFAPSYYNQPYAPYAYYPYAPVVVAPAPQVTYVESAPQQWSQVSSAPGPSGYEYYCNNPDGYYPFIRQCSSGWRQIVPDQAPRSR